MNLKEIFTEETKQYYIENKHEITSELLDSLRSHGNEGKELALEILKTKQDDEMYYLDAFDNRISVNGNRMLKKPFTRLPLSDIHLVEIEKCKNDIFYFMDNYVKIVTPKGINFPDLREYQKDFISIIRPNEHESIVGLLPRQCCSASTTVNIINKNNKEYTTSFEDLFNECKREQ